jgi:iron(III) transport system permease protein
MHRRRFHIILGPIACLALVLVVLSTDTATRRLASNTAGLVGCVVCISLALGSPLAFAISRAEIPFSGLAISLIASLLFVPLYLQASAWQAVWGIQGWLTNVLGTAPLAGWPAVIWIHSAAAIPWVVLIVGLGLDRVEPELEEDALLDASPGRVFWHVTLRRSLPAIAAAALWVAASVAGEMTVTNLYQVQTFSEVVYLQYAATADSEQATQGLLGGTIAIVVGLTVAMVAVAGTISLDRQPTSRMRWTFPLGRFRWLLSFFAWSSLVVLVGVPLVGLVHKTGIVVTRTETGWQRDWSAASALTMVAESPQRFQRELGWSLLIAAVAATLAAGAGLLLAWQARRGGGRRFAAMAVASFALVVPGPLVGISLIQLFHLGDWSAMYYLYDRTITAPVLAQFVKALPLATLVMWPAMCSVPQELLDSAAVDGAGKRTVLWYVVLPLVRRAIAVAWLVGLAVAMGDLAASILVLPPGVETLANRIFGLIHYGVDDQVAGITLAMMMGFVVVGIITRALMRPWYH